MTPEWAAGAAVIFAASLVFGLAGFGIGLVALAFLPFLMAATDAVVLMTLYAFLATLGLFVPLRRDFVPTGLVPLALGTAAGTPLGVWILAAVPVAVLERMIGGMLLLVVGLEWARVYPKRLSGRGWALGAGFAAGVLGGAVGTPGPPVILYAAAQGWPPRTVKANLQAFFMVNQAVILAGYAWAGLLTPVVWRHAAAFALPALAGAVVGVRLFDRIDAARFRQIVFVLLFLSGVALLARG
jgi:uncharacterized membrane protein YfcA